MEAPGRRCASSWCRPNKALPLAPWGSPPGTCAPPRRCQTLSLVAGIADSGRAFVDVSAMVSMQRLPRHSTLSPIFEAWARANGIAWRSQHPGARKERVMAVGVPRAQWKSHMSAQRRDEEVRSAESLNLPSLHVRALLRGCETHPEGGLYGRRHGPALLQGATLVEVATSSTSSAAPGAWVAP